MTVGTGLVLLVAVIVVVVLLSLLLRPRRPRLVNGGRRPRPRGFGRRRMEAIKRAAAADIALVQGNDRLLARPADGDQDSVL